LFGNPGPVVNDLLSAIGIPVLKGFYGGSDAQQSRAIQISDLVVKVAGCGFEGCSVTSGLELFY
jgi:hypothetical protein